MEKKQTESLFKGMEIRYNYIIDSYALKKRRPDA